ncbi:MAG: hypothetical protein CMM25_00270 [Rhodospirillaceae bacterium]|nr:hypothetical protein [Rhodospirillaceae bacterium]|tara:strand:- start:68 stop:271 length:204 start_codon:yes stop_codon:yes gene_type:complete
MKSLKAFSLMGGVTLIVLAILYLLDAHNNYREFHWAVGIAIVLLITHISNMAIYFKITGDQPYKWFK